MKHSNFTEVPEQNFKTDRERPKICTKLANTSRPQYSNCGRKKSLKSLKILAFIYQLSFIPSDLQL